MKYVFLLLFFSPNLYGQTNDTLKGPVNIIDGVYIPAYINCSYDTTAILFSNVQLVFTKAESTNYSFQEGTKNYLVLKLRTKKCRCSDCEFSEEIIIELPTSEKTLAMPVSASNTTWIRWNSWIFPKKEIGFNGTFNLDKDCVSLSLVKYFNEEHTDYILDRFEINNIVIHQ